MFLMARIDRNTGAEREWFVAFTPEVEQVQVTRTRNNARLFKRESDAMSVRDMAAEIAPEHQWKVVAA
ncbi:hypothetical protein [Hyphococcus sp.]|uniref:hypothetical protein n=1 Tax=Hyphococcus sp. TaxID=2038636 RepID=UPI0035C690E0